MATTRRSTTAAGRPVTVWFRAQELRRLDQAARQLGLSRSDVTRAAVGAYVGRVLEGIDVEGVASRSTAATFRKVGAQ